MLIIEIAIFILFLILLIIVLIYKRFTNPPIDLHNTKAPKKGFESENWKLIRNYIEKNEFNPYILINLIENNIEFYKNNNLITYKDYKILIKKIKRYKSSIYFFTNKKKLFNNIINEYLKIKNV